MEDTLSANCEQLQSLADGADLLSSKKRDRGSECSHKVIEKRRRDRINTSLGELSHLLPAKKNRKQGSGKLEKAEILEKTVDYLKTLQGHLSELREVDIKIEDEKTESSAASKQNVVAGAKPDHFGGYKDCTEEVFRFLVNVEAMDMQQPCFQRLMAHLRHRIQLLMEARPDLPAMYRKTSAKLSNGNRTTSKRSFAGTISSSSSSSSLEDTSNGSESCSKAKRARIHGNNNKAATSSSNGHSTSFSSSSDNEHSSDNVQENHSDSAICLEDELPCELPGNSTKEPTDRNGMNRSNTSSGNTNRTENSTSSSTHGPSLLPQGTSVPLRGPFLPTPYALPSYALHPAGTHYIPIVMHPSIPLPTLPTGAGQMPCGMIPGGGAFGMPPQAPGMFGLPFPYVHPGMSPYAGYQPHPLGFPFPNGMCKDLPGQGLPDHGNGDSGSNGDDCSIESRNSSENIANQTDTPSPSNSGNESSNTEDGGS